MTTKTNPNYVIDIKKNNIKADLFRIKRSHRKDTNHSEHFLNQIALWTSFYRANPHRFVRDFLGIELKPFQVFLLHGMIKNNKFMFVGSRGLGSKIKPREKQT